MSSGPALSRPVRQVKVLGGVPTARGEFPYLVSLSYGSDLCGGSILSTLLILTAAHCVKNRRPDRITITAGQHYRNTYFSSRFASEQQTRTASNIYIHENYDWDTDVNDIALVVLSSPLQYTTHVQNISLPGASEDFTTGYATVMGWGTTREGAEEGSDVLRKVKLPIVPTPECRRRYNRMGGIRVTDQMMCAGGESGKDACQGDSGGPVICKREEEPGSYWTRRRGSGGRGTWVQCGIVSHGNGCGREGYPGILTRVSEYIDWIKETRQRIEGLLDTPSQPPCSAAEFDCAGGSPVLVHSRNCIPLNWRCDGERDCSSGADEIGCAGGRVDTTTTTTTSTRRPTFSRYPSMEQQTENAIIYADHRAFGNTPEHRDQQTEVERHTRRSPPAGCTFRQVSCNEGKCIIKITPCHSHSQEKEQVSSFVLAMRDWLLH